MNVLSINILIGFGLIAALLSTVAIDTGFPTVAAERAADSLIEEVWQMKPVQAHSSDEVKSPEKV
jgi:hypothetical protein